MHEREQKEWKRAENITNKVVRAICLEREREQREDKGVMNGGGDTGVEMDWSCDKTVY